MATDLIKRAAAICGIYNPNSDQLAAWLDSKHVALTGDSRSNGRPWWWFAIDCATIVPSMNEWLTCPSGATLLEALAAAVVEVDRIEREART